jgi:hypothetical protein
MTLVVAGALYLALGFLLWVHAWAEGASTHTLCGCGDPALFLWFFQWPATALSHGQNPFFSTALFHPHGINLLSQTSVTGLSVPLVPVTWIWGPVASLNVASTITPALTAFTAFFVIRRWVSWTPAAFVGGLLYGFSPFVLSSLEFAHLMTAALMLLPLILAAFDEILVRQRRSPLWTGVLLAVLLFAQFFLSSELLAIVAVVVVICVVALVLAALVTKPSSVRSRFPYAIKALAVGLGLALVLLAWPVWYALKGPASLSGLVWPNVGVIGGFIPSSFVTTGYPPRSNVFLALGGYEGAPLASAAYVGWSFLAVMAAGIVAFWRDRRLWFFGFVFVVCAACSLGERHGQWEPAWVFTRIPVLENIIEQRFMAVGYLAAAVVLAVILERVRRAVLKWVPQWRGILGSLSALAVAAVALVPMGIIFGERLPFAMQAVTLPRWYSEVAPTLPPGRVLLSYPAPFSGLQSAMAWQAVNRINYSQAGGGGPQGVEARAGAVKAGFRIISLLDFGVGVPEPSGTPAQYAAVRHALADWQVNTVVIATNPAAPRVEQGHDPTYAAAFMTAALGRRPTVEAGAWVWDNVQLGLNRPLVLPAGTLATCAGAAEGKQDVFRATMQVVDCVSGGALHEP